MVKSCYRKILTGSYLIGFTELAKIQVCNLRGNQAANPTFFLGQQCRDAADASMCTVRSPEGIVDVSIGNRSEALGKRLDVRFFVLNKIKS